MTNIRSASIACVVALATLLNAQPLHADDAATNSSLFDLKAAPVAGDAKAPHVLVVYACATCPACGRITPWLHEQVTAGSLRGKARLYFRPFPLRGHPGSREANLGFVAAARLGKFWPFMVAHYKDDQPWSVGRQRAHARAAHLDAKRFIFMLNDAETEQQLIDSRKEGLRHPIEATPTLYIDGHKYGGKPTPEELITEFAKFDTK